MGMSFSVNNNASASNILSNLDYVQNQLQTSYQQLSSGNRINSAADDPAGYAISQQMTSQVNGLNQATQNAQNAVSLLQTASGAMNQVMNILQTMNTLAVEASNGTQTTQDLSNLKLEFTDLSNQINNIGTQTQFNTMNLLGATSVITTATTFTFQVGPQQSQTLSVAISAVNITALGLAGVDISSTTDAQQAITSIQSAITNLSAYQANVGAVEDQLNYTISNLQNSAENLQNANSTITNTNMAQTYTNFSQQQVLNQVGIAMLSQAQQQPDAILKLLS